MPDNVGFLFAAFTIVWLLVFGYMAFLGNRISALRQDLNELDDELDTRLQYAEKPRAAVGEEQGDLVGTPRD